MKWSDQEERWIDGDELRKGVRSRFEQLGTEVNMDARCVTGWDETSVTFETDGGEQHHFAFAPTLDEDEKPYYTRQALRWW
jgi:hypothetical protein